MKKNEIAIGGMYVCKVSGRLAPVRIVQENPLGGWNGVNVTTGRGVRVRSAARLRRQVERAAIAVGTRVTVNIGQGLAVIQGTIAEAEYDDGHWIYRIDTLGGNECPDHRNKAGELWVWHSEVRPLTKKEV